MNTIDIYSEKCRLCLDQPGVKNIGKINGLTYDIYLCTGVKVVINDYLPQKICQMCFEIISKATELRMVAMKNDSRLKSLLDSDDDYIPISLMCDVIISTPSDSKDEDSCEEDRNETTHFIKEENTIEPANDVDEDDQPLIFRKKIYDTKDSNSSYVIKEGILIRRDLIESKELVITKRKININKKNNEGEAKTRGRRKKIRPDILHECQQCGKKYATSKKLYIHKRQHTRRVACTLEGCEKMFPTRSELNRHMRSHTGDRPFTCNICDKGFTQNGTLKQHKQNVHHIFPIGFRFNGSI